MAEKVRFDSIGGYRILSIEQNRVIKTDHVDLEVGEKVDLYVSLEGLYDVALRYMPLLGVQNGYIVIKAKSPAFIQKIGYPPEPNHLFARADYMCRLEEIAHVHGGWTYMNEFSPGPLDIFNIQKFFLIIGFDTAHFGDYTIHYPNGKNWTAIDVLRELDSAVLSFREYLDK